LDKEKWNLTDSLHKFEKPSGFYARPTRQGSSASFPRTGISAHRARGFWRFRPTIRKIEGKKNPLLADILTSLLVHADLASTGNPFQPIIAKWLFVFNSNFLRVKETVLSR